VWEGKYSLCKILAVKPEGKRQFDRLERQWEDNIKISFKIIIFQRRAGLSWLMKQCSGGLYRARPYIFRLNKS
jgi:hypothetical protein